MLKKGPEIKLPELKVPDFLLDVYYDLRERHLLPLVALLVLAIIAVPIALSTGTTSNPNELGVAEEGAGFATVSKAEKEGKIIVAKSAPGLRDYRRRLEHRHPKDPFRELSPSSNVSGDEATSTTAEGSSSVSGEEPTSSEPGSSPSLPDELAEGDNNPDVPGGGEFKFYSYAIDVRVVPVSSGGTKSKAKPTVRHNLPGLTKLPSRETPAVVFIGVTKDSKKAVMLISSNVTGTFGDGICVAGGSEACQLMALEPGVPETFVYGGKRQTFRIEVLKIRLLATDKLNTAPLGKPKKKQKQNG